jgi:hypothetical protein
MTQVFIVLPLTPDMADIEIIKALQNDGIGFFTTYMEGISTLMESMSSDAYNSCLDIKYFRSFLDIYYFDNICIDNNQRWVYFAKAVNENPNVLNLINLMERKSLFIENIIPYMDYYDILHLLVKKEFMDVIHEKDLITRIHRKGKLVISNFFRNDSTRELAIEWLNYYISENNCFRSFATLTGDQILNIGEKFCEMNKLNKQLLKIYFKGITNERRIKFKDDVVPSDDMTFLNKLFIIIHRLTAICVLPMLKLIKNLEGDLTAIERYNETHNDSGALDNLLRIRMLKSIIERVKLVDSNKELVIKFYSEETVHWLYATHPTHSDKLDDILLSFISYIKQPFIQLYFDKELYYVCRKILTKETDMNSVTKSNYIRGEIINLLAAYLPFHQYFLNIWLINDELFIKNRFVELYIEFNELEDDDANVYKNQTLEILKHFHNKDFIHNDEEIVHHFSHLILESYNNYYENYIAVIKCLHNYDYNIPFTEEESQTIRRDTADICSKNAQWFQKNIYFMYEFINNSPIIKNVLLPGTKEKFIVMIGKLLKVFTSDERNTLKLFNYKNNETFEPLQHLLNIYSMFAEFSNNSGFRKGLIEETRFMNPIYIKKMLDVLFKKNKILESEYDTVMEVHNYIIEEREKYNQNNSMDSSIEIPDEFLDPIMGSVIEDPVCLPNTDIIMERDVILRHLLENQDNPFNREPLTKKELNDFNARDDIISKIAEFNTKKKHYIDSTSN